MFTFSLSLCIKLTTRTPHYFPYIAKPVGLCRFILRWCLFVCWNSLTFDCPFAAVITLSAIAHRTSWCIQARKWRLTSRCLPFLAQCGPGSPELFCGPQHRSCRKHYQLGHDGWSRSSLEWGFQASQLRSWHLQLRRKHVGRLHMILIFQRRQSQSLWSRQSLICLPPQ